jgi:hypothetical protein
MRRLVTIDLSNADVPTFEAYEKTVLSLLPKYGARLEIRVRSLDGFSETHLLFFPNVRSFESYCEDTIRLAAQSSWKACGAKAVVSEVELLASH